MAIQDFDKLNILQRRSMPYREYYSDMELTPRQKKNREDLALILEDYIMFYFDLIETGIEMDLLDEIKIKQEMVYSLYDIVVDKEFFENEKQLDKYVNDYVNEAFRSTVENLVIHPNDYDYTGEKQYWVSEDRAMFIAENEANTLFNGAEFLEARREGHTHKIWMAYPDDRVRPTHEETNGAKIPIGTYFDVGNARMLYPKDVTSELSTALFYPEEVINCRCTIKYV